MDSYEFLKAQKEAILAKEKSQAEQDAFERGRREGIERAAQACENEKRCYADSHRTHDEFCHDQDAAAIRALTQQQSSGQKS